MKSHAAHPRDLPRAEARGLAWLADAGALRVPRGPGGLGRGRPRLVTSSSSTSRRCAPPGYAEALGRGLARAPTAPARRASATSSPTTSATLPQDNTPDRRLGRLLRRAPPGPAGPRGDSDADQAPAPPGRRDSGPDCAPGSPTGSGRPSRPRGCTATSGPAPCTARPAGCAGSCFRILVYGGDREVDLAQPPAFQARHGAASQAHDEAWTRVPPGMPRPGGALPALPAARARPPVRRATRPRRRDRPLLHLRNRQHPAAVSLA